MERQHALLGPSSLDKRLQCIGSYFLEQHKDLADYENPYSTEGDEFHDIIESDDLTNAEDEKKRYLKEWRALLDHWVGIRYESRADSKVYYQIFVQGTEEYLVHPSLAEVEGTPDYFCIAYDPVNEVFVIHVFDQKYGKGEMVNPRGNKQILGYFVIIFRKFYDVLRDIMDDPKEVQFRATVHQPRGYEEPIKTHFTDYTEVFQFEKRIEDLTRTLNYIDRRGMNVEENLRMGPHCKYCRAKVICPLINDGVRQNAKDFDADQAEYWVDLYEALKSMPTLVQQLEFQMLSYVQTRGARLPGMKVVESMGNTRWRSDQKETLRELRKLGLTPNQVHKKTLLTVNQLCEAIKKDEDLLEKVDIGDVKALAHRVSRGYKIVPESHKGRAVDIRPVSALFKEEPIDGEES